VNQQLDAVRTLIAQQVPAGQQAAILTLVEAARSQANELIDAAIARCP